MASLMFRVERGEPELIPPSKLTPYEFKYLSNLDDQKCLRKYNSALLFYENSKRMDGRDPVKIIKEALGETLVPYYPFAGRLREGPEGKLVVECTGEGVLFIEGNASVCLEQFGDVPRPPFPFLKELLYDVPGSDGVLGCPLLVIQVTRLKCGGFIVGISKSHVISDAGGFVQLMTALGEMACGARFPSIEPIWKRELLKARKPPKVSCTHHVYQNLGNASVISQTETVPRSFFFGLKELEKLKDQLPTHLKCSKIDILFACLWKCRTIALGLGFDGETRLAFAVNARAKFIPPLPVGFYGNAFGIAVAVSTAGELRSSTMGYAIELIQRAKADVTEEFMRSTIDHLAELKQPTFETTRTYHVSDLTKIGFAELDLGWGKPVYGGPTWGGAPSSFLVSSKNKEGETGILVTMDLPRDSMERFATEIQRTVSCSSVLDKES